MMMMTTMIAMPMYVTVVFDAKPVTGVAAGASVAAGALA